MEIKFDVFFNKNLGTIYKDNSIDLDGIDTVVDLDLSQVNYIHVNFEVGSESFTDTVVIKDINNKIVQIPFKTDVLKQGINQFELVATMKNGDVKPSQTCKYSIIKSLKNPNSVQADTNYPILIDLINRVSNISEDGGTGGIIEGHTHANKTTLDKITEQKLISWDNKLDSVPSEYITETELNSKGYLTQHQDISMKVDKVTGKSLIADTEISRLAGIVNYVHPTTHLPSVIVQDSDNRFVTDTEKYTWNAKSNFSGSYTNLTNKPTIPTVTNDLTSTLKTNYDDAYIHSQSSHAPSTAQKNSDITKEEIEAKLTGVISSHSHEGTSSSGSGSSEKLLMRYTHTSNKVIQPTSFDFSTGIFTCSEVHGLKGGENLLLDFIPPPGVKFNQLKILKELYQFSWTTWYFLVAEVVTTTTFKLKNRANNSYITYTSSNTPNLDLNSFRFQVANELKFENLNISNCTKLKFRLNLFTMSQTYPNVIKILSTTKSNYPLSHELSAKFNNIIDISSLYYPIADCCNPSILGIYGQEAFYRNDIVENTISIAGNTLSRSVSFYTVGFNGTYTTHDNNTIIRNFNCKDYFYDVGYDNGNRFLNSITINNEHKILNGSIVEIYDLGGE